MSNVGRDQPEMSGEDIQTVDKALNDLRVAMGLPPRDPRRRDAAVSLRTAGFTTPQIVALSRGNWPRQSVDRWVEGAAMPAGAPAERAVEIFADAVTRNLTPDTKIKYLSERWSAILFVVKEIKVRVRRSSLESAFKIGSCRFRLVDVFLPEF